MVKAETERDLCKKRITLSGNGRVAQIMCRSHCLKRPDQNFSVESRHDQVLPITRPMQMRRCSDMKSLSFGFGGQVPDGDIFSHASRRPSLLWINGHGWGAYSLVFGLLSVAAGATMTPAASSLARCSGYLSSA